MERALKFQIGERVQIQRISPDNNDRYVVSVIGFLEGQSLLITPPMVDGKILYLREGQRFAVRMLHGSDIQGFVTTVLYAPSRPFPHVHLVYPDEVERIAVRNAIRIDSHISGLARNTRDPDSNEHWNPILIKDISLTGCRLESASDLGEVQNRMAIQFRVSVCGVDESLMLLAEICSSESGDERSKGRTVTGCSFFQINRYQQVMLNGFILEQLMEEE
ncbi:MAG: flagellar brake protein [Gammaproteobacteria bacterium]|nr:flagellar brake protein [Gammaproteobacteria bacterium]